jgi:hypothetical protein
VVCRLVPPLVDDQRAVHVDTYPVVGGGGEGVGAGGEALGLHPTGREAVGADPDPGRTTQAPVVVDRRLAALTRATADPANWFAETNNANNGTWVNIKLTGSGVRVVAYGPVA